MLNFHVTPAWKTFQKVIKHSNDSVLIDFFALGDEKLPVQVPTWRAIQVGAVLRRAEKDQALAKWHEKEYSSSSPDYLSTLKTCTSFMLNLSDFLASVVLMGGGFELLNSLEDPTRVVRDIVSKMDGILPICAEDFLGPELWARVQKVLSQGL